MSRHVAFLRGLNVGRHHRVTNEELCACFEKIGLTDPVAYMASGNVVFDGGTLPATEAERLVADGLEDALGYPVPTFVRSAEEVRRIAAFEPFSGAELAATAGRVQVGMLAATPSDAARREVLAMATVDDRLTVDGAELYWLPREGISTSELDLGAVESALGSMTVRTQRTVERIAKKLFAG